MNIYKKEVTEEIQEHRGYFKVCNARTGLVDSMGTPQTSSNIKPLLVDDREDKLHFLHLENFHTVYSFSELRTYKCCWEAGEMGQKK